MDSAKGTETASMRRHEEKEALLPLTALPLGSSARIGAVKAEGALRTRMTELGYLPGERVKKVLVSPLGEPCAYLVRGTVTALRRCDAERVFIVKEAEKWG